MPDYDVMYSRLDLSPGEGLDKITKRGRQLIQCLHPDRWSHDPNFSEFWRSWTATRYMEVKEAKDSLEEFWSVHNRAPPINAQREMLQEQLRQMQAQKDALSRELPPLRAERDKLQAELDRLKAEVVPTRMSAAALCEQVRKDASRPLEEAQNDRGLMRELVFAHLEDPSYGPGLRILAVVIGLLLVWKFVQVVSHTMFSWVDPQENWPSLEASISWSMGIALLWLLFGNFRAQSIYCTAQRAGRQRVVEVPASKLLQNVTQGLLERAQLSGHWRLERCDERSGDNSLALLAVFFFGAPGAKPRQHSVRLSLQARPIGLSGTAIAYQFKVQAPIWQQLAVARVVRDAQGRLESAIKG
jgi:hypothetical protein